MQIEIIVRGRIAHFLIPIYFYGQKIFLVIISFSLSENSAWSLDKIFLRQENTTLAYINPRTPKTLLNYIIKLRRKSFYYFVYLFSPCLLSSILMIMIFVLPPECGERMVVGITSMLALTVFFLLAAKNIPETSEDVPLMGR